MLVVGCGDVGLRAARLLGRGEGRIAGAGHVPRCFALARSTPSADALRAAGVVPLAGDLDAPATLSRLAGIATHVMHLAPPPSGSDDDWWRDPRTQALVRALRRRRLPEALVYVSTSGVYGDCRGERVSESRPARPSTPRAQRRVDAERLLRSVGRGPMRVNLLRAPGIYANDREGGTPRERLLRGTPVLAREDDVYTNHVHADDLARACVLALWRGRPQRVFNVNDDSDMRMGDYFDLAADLYGLPRPPRIARSTAEGQMPLGVLSFMSESRRLVNDRVKKELGLALRYPHVRQGLSPQLGLL